MARFVLGLEQFSALAEGHLLELHDPYSALTIELALDPDIGWPRSQTEAEAIRRMLEWMAREGARHRAGR